MKLLLQVLLPILFAAPGAHGETDRFDFPQGEVRLMNHGNRLGLFFQMKEHWHIYWKNSGDSGAAPRWDWEIQGGTLTETKWPVPQRIPVSGLINFGYSDQSLIVFNLQPEAKKVTARVSLEFLICKVECIPYFADLKKTFSPSTSTPDSQKIFSKWTYPKPLPKDVRWTIHSQDPTTLKTRLVLPGNLSKDLKNLRVFPEDGALFQSSAPQVEITKTNDYKIDLRRQGSHSQDIKKAHLLLTLENSSGQVQAFNATVERSQTALWLILLWAALGGLILNVMPCVFPVLSIKVMSFLGPEKDRSQLRASGWFYTFGILTSFLALGGILVGLRAGGMQIGWGFQLQNPLLTGGLSLLFFWLAFNFLGTFEIGQSLTNLGASQKASGNWGSFLTGVLATIVATPCTAPFMGAALGASLTLPLVSSLLVFAGLGLGMALPFLILAYFPQALQWLPKPGPWMQRLKEFLAFPLFATSLWLIWVLSHQVSTSSLFFLLGLFLLVGLWIWVAQNIATERRRQAFLAVGFLASLAAVPAQPPAFLEKSTPKKTESNWQAYSQDNVAQSLENGRSVFIDFTAAWCITCQVNKKFVLNTNSIQRAFKEKDTALYKADWTEKDPHITKALESYGRNSLPLYVFYPKGSSEPMILPEILTKDIVLNTINKEKPQ